MKIKIQNQQVKETATTTINDNTVVFNYEYSKQKLPKKVDFSVFRKAQNGEPVQQAIGGSLQKDGAFTSYNLGGRHRGDGALLDDVYEICEAIIDGAVEKEVESNKEVEDVKK